MVHVRQHLPCSLPRLVVLCHSCRIAACTAVRQFTDVLIFSLCYCNRQLPHVHMSVTLIMCNPLLNPALPSTGAVPDDALLFFTLTLLKAIPVQHLVLYGNNEQ